MSKDSGIDAMHLRHSEPQGESWLHVVRERSSKLEGDSLLDFGDQSTSIGRSKSRLFAPASSEVCPEGGETR